LHDFIKILHTVFSQSLGDFRNGHVQHELCAVPKGVDLKRTRTKFTFGWGSTPDPARGAYSAPLDPLGGFKGAYF